ncbi:MAG: FAD-dependent oxidoreductase [Methylotetracoccus sp.]
MATDETTRHRTTTGEPGRILILGGGFAGLWSAAAAARALSELGKGPDSAETLLVNRDAYHGIRVRNYEADIASARLPLADVLDPIGVRHVLGEVAAIDTANRSVDVAGTDGVQRLRYDRMVFALGSEIARPPLPGLAQHAFDVDTYANAESLARHLASLPHGPARTGRYTAIVVGAGPTGIETAAELPARLRALNPDASARDIRVILLDRSRIGAALGPSAEPVIAEALHSLGIETRGDVEIQCLDEQGIRLRGGEAIPAATLIWCGGLRANPWTRELPVELDPLGRAPVDPFMQVRGVPGVFAAGDSANALLDERHHSVMSCQHSRPMGRYAGYNAARDLFGLPMVTLRIDGYVTVVDLGCWGAVYTEGWEHRLAAVGKVAKETKRIINTQRIYPPPGGDRGAILAAAAPVVQTPPGYAA